MVCMSYGAHPGTQDGCPKGYIGYILMSEYFYTGTFHRYITGTLEVHLTGTF